MQDKNKKNQLFLKQTRTELKRRLSAEEAEQAISFSDVFFRRVALSDLRQESSSLTAAMLISQLEFLKSREQGQAKIRVFNPEESIDGWKCKRTVVELANDDMPFLVDTASMVLQEHGVDVRLIIHPVLNVERGSGNSLKAFHDGASEASAKESFIHIQIEKLNKENLQKII
jgi:glutamate dehydrogenase